jgi:hypothetical protein
MATDPNVPPAAAPTPVVVEHNQPQREIRIYSHSGLFYWWPLWFFGFLFALWTWFEDDRMVIIPGRDAIITKSDAEKKLTVEVRNLQGKIEELRIWKEGEPVAGNPNEVHPRMRVTSRAWMGPLFFTILFLVILITNIPLRGLWSLVVIIGIALLAVMFSLFDWWDNILQQFGNLHVYINMAGYLFIATIVFLAWVLSVFVFDRRTYMVFTQGQVRIIEEIGGREKVYDTTGLTVEKQRQDWFRHIILGFGSGDLTVKTAGADRHEILMPNVALIGFKIDAINELVRSRPTTR